MNVVEFFRGAQRFHGIFREKSTFSRISSGVNAVLLNSSGVRRKVIPQQGGGGDIKCNRPNGYRVFGSRLPHTFVFHLSSTDKALKFNFSALHFVRSFEISFTDITFRTHRSNYVVHRTSQSLPRFQCNPVRRGLLKMKYILLNVLVCSIAEYFYEFCFILNTNKGLKYLAIIQIRTFNK